MTDTETKLKTFGVTLPIAGHAYVIVQAADEEAAIDAAFEQVTVDDFESWEAIRRFQQGNVSYCPQPWEAEAVDETPDEA